MGNDILKLSESLQGQWNAREYIYASPEGRESDADKVYDHILGRAVKITKGDDDQSIGDALAKYKGEKEKSLAYVVDRFLQSYTYHHQSKEFAANEGHTINAGGSGPNLGIYSYEQIGSEDSRDVASANYFRGLAIQQVLNQIEEKKNDLAAFEAYVKSIPDDTVKEILTVMQGIGVKEATPSSGLSEDQTKIENKNKLLNIISKDTKVNLDGVEITALEELRKNFPKYIGGYCGALQKTLFEFGAFLTHVTGITLQHALHDAHNNDFKDVGDQTYVVLKEGTRQFKDFEDHEELLFRDGEFLIPANCVHSQCMANIEHANMELTRNLRRFLTGIVPDQDLVHYKLDITSWSVLQDGDDYESSIRHLMCLSRFSGGVRPFDTGKDENGNELTVERKVAEALSLSFKGKEIAGQQQNHADANRSDPLEPYADEGQINYDIGDGRSDQKSRRTMDLSMIEAMFNEAIGKNPRSVKGISKDSRADLLQRAHNGGDIKELADICFPELPQEQQRKMTSAQAMNRAASKIAFLEQLKDAKLTKDQREQRDKEVLADEIISWLNDTPVKPEMINVSSIGTLNSVRYRESDKLLTDLLFGNGVHDGNLEEMSGFRHLIEGKIKTTKIAHLSHLKRHIKQELKAIEKTLLADSIAKKHRTNSTDADKYKLVRNVHPPKRGPHRAAPDERVAAGGWVGAGLGVGTIATIAGEAAKSASALSSTVTEVTKKAAEVGGYLGSAGVSMLGGTLAVAGAIEVVNSFNVAERLGKDNDEDTKRYNEARDTLINMRKHEGLNKRRNALINQRKAHLGDAIGILKAFYAQVKYKAGINNDDYLNRIRDTLKPPKKNNDRGFLDKLEAIEHKEEALELWDIEEVHDILTAVKRMAEYVLRNLASDPKNVHLREVAEDTLDKLGEFLDVSHEPRYKAPRKGGKEKDVNPKSWAQLLQKPLLIQEKNLSTKMLTIYNKLRENQSQQKDNVINGLTGTTYIAAGGALIATAVPAVAAAVPYLGPVALGMLTGTSALNAGNTARQMNKASKAELHVNGDHHISYTPQVRGYDAMNIALQAIHGYELPRWVLETGYLDAAFLGTLTATGFATAAGLASGPVGAGVITGVNVVAGFGLAATKYGLSNRLAAANNRFPARSENTPLNDVYSLKTEGERNKLRWNINGASAIFKETTEEILDSIYEQRKEEYARHKPLYSARKNTRLGVQNVSHPSQGTDDRNPLMYAANRWDPSWALKRRINIIFEAYRNDWQTNVYSADKAFRLYTEGRRSQLAWERGVIENELLITTQVIDMIKSDNTHGILDKHNTEDSLKSYIEEEIHRLDKNDRQLRGSLNFFKQVTEFEENYRSFLEKENPSADDETIIQDSFRSLIVDFAYSTNGLASLISRNRGLGLANADNGNIHVKAHTREVELWPTKLNWNQKINNIEFSVEKPLPEDLKRELKQDAFKLLAELFARAYPTLLDNEIMTIQRMNLLAMESSDKVTPVDNVQAKFAEWIYEGLGVSMITEDIKRESGHRIGKDGDALQLTETEKDALSIDREVLEDFYKSAYKEKEQRPGRGRRYLPRRQTEILDGNSSITVTSSSNSNQPNNSRSNSRSVTFGGDTDTPEQTDSGVPAVRVMDRGDMETGPTQDFNVINYVNTMLRNNDAPGYGAEESKDEEAG